MANERIISADSHVNPPKELWTSRAPAKFRERAPRVESTPQGDFWIVDSQVSGGIGLDASAGHKPEEFRPAGMTYKDMRPGSYDPKARLADMDLDGVDAEVLYFGGPVTSLSPDPELRRYVIQTYNDWMVELSKAAPTRLVGLAHIPILDLAEGMAELRRVAKLGLRGFHVDPFPDERGGKALWDPAYEPFWSLVEGMDQTFNKHRFWTKSVITEKPSTYWYHQGHATFIQDLAGVAARHRAGLRNIMWSTDYPHSDSTWPKSREALAAHFQDVPESERALIAGGNAAALYGLN